MTRARVKGWVLAAAALLVVVLVTTASDAAVLQASTAGLTIHLQQVMTPVLVGPVAFGPRVLVPTRPTPRSPFQPPTWVPSTPPWLR